MSLHSLPSRQPDDDGGSLAHELYTQAVEEYRFQAKYNWSRVQYFLAFNVAILAAGGAVAPRAVPPAVALFVLGAISCAIGWRVQITQHQYYRHARDRLKRVEEELQIPKDLRFDTTAKQRGGSQKVTVTNLVNLLLAAILIADVVSAVLTVAGS